MIPLSGRVPGRGSKPSRTRVDDGGGSVRVSGKVFGLFRFSRRGVFVGERAKLVEARGPHTLSLRGRIAGRAGRGCGPLGVPLRVIFGVLEPPGKNRNFDVKFVQFREYFLNNFSETKNSRKQATGTVASC